MRPDLSGRARSLRECMDDPGASLHTLERTYARFAVVNAVVSGIRAVYRRDIRPRARKRPLRIADIGTGGADIPRMLLKYAQHDGLELTIVAVDPDERAMAWAKRQPAVPGLEFMQASSPELVAAGERFDLVYSNHLLHHLDAVSFTALLQDSEQLLRDDSGLAVHCDIARSRRAYLSFAVGTGLFASTLFADTFIRQDGLTSIRRSYTAAELTVELAGAAPSWTVRRGAPCRLELRWEPGAH